MRRPRPVIARVEALEARQPVSPPVSSAQLGERIGAILRDVEDHERRGEPHPPPKNPWSEDREVLAQRVARLLTDHREAQ